MDDQDMHARCRTFIRQYITTLALNQLFFVSKILLESSLSTLPLLQILLRQRILECTQKTALLRSELANTCDGDGTDMEGTAEARVARIQEGIGVRPIQSC